MAGKIYVGESTVTKQIDSESIANNYDSFVSDIAKMIDRLSEIKGRCRFLSEVTEDNGDPVYKTEEATTYLGELLSTLVIYRDEYRAEIENSTEDQ